MACRCKPCASEFNLWSLHIYQDPNDHGVSQTLPGHDGFITCVKFIKDDIIVSTDTKGTLRLWRKNISQAGKGFSLGLLRANDIGQWKALRTIQAHSKSISCLYVKAGHLVTGSSDSCVKFWKVGEECKQILSLIWPAYQHTLTDDLIAVQTIGLNGRYPLALSLAYLPQSNGLIF